VDGKAIYIAGEEGSLLVGVDQATHDVVHAVVAEVEGEEASSAWSERRSPRAATR